MRRWHSLSSALHHSLGLAYYCYEWLVAFGFANAIGTALFGRTTTAIIIGTATSTVLLTIGAGAWLTFSVKRIAFLNPDVDITRFVATYTIDPESRYVLEMQVGLRSRRAGVECFKRRFRWTGTGEVLVLVEPEGIGTASLTKSTDVWDLIKVEFSRPLMQDEERNFVVKVKLTDSGQTALPVFRNFIDDAYASGFTMQVKLPSRATSSSREIYPSARSLTPIRSAEQPDCQTSELVWRVRHPRPGRRYDINWTT